MPAHCLVSEPEVFMSTSGGWRRNEGTPGKLAAPPISDRQLPAEPLDKKYDFIPHRPTVVR